MTPGPRGPAGRREPPPAGSPPPPVIRMAGLPVAVLAQLRFRRTMALVNRLVARQEWLATEGQRLADALHEVIAAAPEGDTKPRLVGLRRAIYRGRSPASSEWDPTLAATVPTALRERIHRWLRVRSEDRAGTDRLPSTLACEAIERTQALRAVATDPRLRRALRLASPSLANQLDRWLAGRRQPTRRLLLGLAKYVSRAATKTSPFSTFTLSGFGRWAPAGRPVALATSQVNGVTEFRWPARDRVVQALATKPELRDTLLVRVNPSLTADHDRLSFLGPAPDEPVLAVPATPAVQRCLNALPPDQPASLGAVRHRLTTDDPGADHAQVGRFLSGLVEIGLLEASPPVGDQAISAGWGGLQQWVTANGGEDLRDLGQLLSTVERLMGEQVPVSDLTWHRELHRQLRRTVADLGRRLGDADLAGLDEPAGRNRTVIHDAAVLAGVAGECAQPLWQEALADLRVVGDWLSLFDRMLPVRLAAADFFLDRYPASARLPFLMFYRAVQEEIAAGSPAGAELHASLALEPSPGWSARVREAGELRSLAQQAEWVAHGTGGQRRVSIATLAEQAARWPGWVSRPRSLGCYVQPLLSPGGLELVLNVVDAGYGKGRSRLAHLARRAGQQPPDLEGAHWTGAIPAELASPPGWSLNDREPCLPYEIDYPFARSVRPPDQRLPLHDLVVGCGEHGLLGLHSRRLGTPIQTIHLGLLWFSLLPPAARLLTHLFGEVSLPPPAALLEGPASYLPRLTAGRIVLRRSRWMAASATVPTRDGREPDTGYLLRLTRWRRQHGIPSRCFVHFRPDAGTDPPPGTSHKPLYVDFENWFLVLAFENQLKPDQTVIFQESLPDPEAAAEPAAAPRALELLVEVSQPGSETHAVA